MQSVLNLAFKCVVAVKKNYTKNSLSAARIGDRFCDVWSAVRLVIRLLVGHNGGEGVSVTLRVEDCGMTLGLAFITTTILPPSK